MKKLLLTLFITGLSASIVSAQWNRYIEEPFDEVTTTTDVQFGTNYNFIFGENQPLPGFALNTDIYQPVGDTETNRAAVVLLHTGNFLPKYLNKSPSGNNKDSAIVVSAEMFAKRGYVAFAPNYRTGWDATNVDPVTGADARRGTLISAVYRALSDVRSLVRFIRKTVAEDGNPYGVDPNKIIIYGHGSGGYISFAYGSLDRIEELEDEITGKWLSTTDVVLNNNQDTIFHQGELYVDTALHGGIDGLGGSLNLAGNPGYSSDVLACINVGGALGDSAWIEVGEPPIISFHVPDDGFAPFTQGLVIVPTTQEVVVDVVGSRWAVRKANELGNNDVLYGSSPLNDPYTARANEALSSSHMSYPSAQMPNPVELLNLNPSDYKGLFPFILPEIQYPFQESSPWQWWDEQVVVSNAAPLVGGAAEAQALYDQSIAGSPSMSAAFGRAYLDTIQGFLAPRLRQLLMQDVSVEENDFVNSNMFVYPNPANDYLVVKTNQGIRITDVEIYDITGKMVRTENGLHKLSHQINGIDQLVSGLYLVKVTTDQGLVTRKVFVD